MHISITGITISDDKKEKPDAGEQVWQPTPQNFAFVSGPIREVAGDAQDEEMMSWKRMEGFLVYWDLANHLSSACQTF